MVRLLKLKFTLIVLAILLAGWNYFLRESFSLPFLSDLSSNSVYLIAGGIFVLDVIINFAFGERY